MYCGSGLVRGSRGKGPPGADLRGGGVVVEEVEVVGVRADDVYAVMHQIIVACVCIYYKRKLKK